MLTLISYCGATKKVHATCLQSLIVQCEDLRDVSVSPPWRMAILLAMERGRSTDLSAKMPNAVLRTLSETSRHRSTTTERVKVVRTMAATAARLTSGDASCRDNHTSSLIMGQSLSVGFCKRASPWTAWMRTVCCIKWNETLFAPNVIHLYYLYKRTFTSVALRKSTRWIISKSSTGRHASDPMASRSLCIIWTHRKRGAGLMHSWY